MEYSRSVAAESRSNTPMSWMCLGMSGILPPGLGLIPMVPKASVSSLSTNSGPLSMYVTGAARSIPRKVDPDGMVLVRIPDTDSKYVMSALMVLNSPSRHDS